MFGTGEHIGYDNLGSVLVRYGENPVGEVFKGLWIEVGKYLGVGTRADEGVSFVRPIFMGLCDDGEGLGVCMCCHYGPM